MKWHAYVDEEALKALLRDMGTNPLVDIAKEMIKTAGDKIEANSARGTGRYALWYSSFLDRETNEPAVAVGYNKRAKKVWAKTFFSEIGTLDNPGKHFLESTLNEWPAFGSKEF